MTRLFLLLLTLLFSLSGPAMGMNSEFGRSTLAAKTVGGGADDVVDLYRFVSPAEFDDIARTGQFRFAPGQMEAKQFGFNIDEVLKLSDHFPDAAAIMKAQVPRSILQRLDLTPVDSSFLRSGSATALGAEQLQLLNQSLLGPIKHAF